ncbi:MAG: hypothetical protein QM783_19820 [Phycisphaerales bacterium]
MSAASVSLPLLQNARIASPCPTRWDEMSLTGDERTRHCERCSLNVHNISAMTSDEAEAFLAKFVMPNADGTMPRLCGHLVLRADGTIMTADCPVGLAAVRARARRAVVRIAAAIGLTAAVGWAAARQSAQTPFAQSQPLSTLAAWLRGQPAQPPASASLVDGWIVLPTPTAPPSSGVGP